ncbi:MAG: hypothetical protein WC477_00215 [Patescibacteria group bacterium]
MNFLSNFIKRSPRTPSRHFSFWWWFGVPVAVIFFSYGPFILMNCVLHAGGSACWRVFSVGHLIFDFQVYQEFATAAAVGMVQNEGILPSAFGALFRGGHLLFPSLSMPELWLIFRIIFGIATWWMLSYLLGVWTQASRTTRRVAASVLWLAIFLPLGFRQGAYSWYAPFGFFALAACVQTVRNLDARRYARAVLWTLAACIASLAYPWFVVFSILWLLSVWIEKVVSLLRMRWIAGCWALGAIVPILGILYVAHANFPRVKYAVASIVRNGLGFSNQLVISNMLVAGIAWLAVVCILSVRSKTESNSQELLLLLRAWGVTILAWCASVPMGFFLGSDHFRFYVFLFAWISIVAFLPRISGIQNDKGKWMLFAICFIALIASCKYLAGPYALNHDQLNTMHLFTWLSLGLFCLLCLFPKWTLRLPPRRVATASLFLALCIGIPQYAVMFSDENARWQPQHSMEPLMSWMRAAIPERDIVCPDPVNAEFLGSESGRVTFFTLRDVNANTEESWKDGMEMLATIRRVDADTVHLWTFFLQQRYITCEQFGLQRSVLNYFYSSERTDVILGCDRAGWNADADFVNRLPAYFGTATNGIAKTCPWIVVDKTMKDSWSIPQEYQKQYDDANFEVYHVQK